VFRESNRVYRAIVGIGHRRVKRRPDPDCREISTALIEDRRTPDGAQLSSKQELSVG
jgi:hypothetical protein